MKSFLQSAFVAVLLLGCAIPAARADTDPLVGTWKLNLAKSTFGGIPAVKSETRIYSKSARGVTMKMIVVSAEGKETTTDVTYKLDGKDFKSVGNFDFDSLSGMQIDPNTAEFTLKRAGNPVGTIRRTVSEDRQTLTINFVLRNANGVQTTALNVYDRQ
jgi:hypothetical protein